jgi:hypothetical protein
MHFASALWFAERGLLRPKVEPGESPQGSAYWEIIYTDNTPSSPGWRYGRFGQKLFPLEPVGKPAFHTVDFRVSADYQALSWGEERVDKRALADLVACADVLRNTHKGWEAVRPRFAPSGGFGIVVCDSSATVRNVVIEP